MLLIDGVASSDGTGSRPVPSRPGKSDFFPVPSRPEGFFIIPGISRDNSVPSRELSVPSRISHVIKIFFFTILKTTQLPD